MAVDVAAKTIRRRGKPDTTVIVQKIEQKPREHTPSLWDKVANSDFFFVNWHIKGSDKDFPYNVRLRKVDKYYPHAEGGPLCIDMAESDQELEDCKLKEPVIKKLGIRYLVLRPRMDFNAAMQALESSNGNLG